MLDSALRVLSHFPEVTQAARLQTWWAVPEPGLSLLHSCALVGWS